MKEASPDYVVSPGQPFPLGSTVLATGVNFAVRSQGATVVELLLFVSESCREPAAVLPLTRTGAIWHCHVAGLSARALYLYRADGAYTPEVDGARFCPEALLLDPYSKAVTRVADNQSVPPKSVAVLAEFDWQDDVAPGYAMEDSFIYELNVRGFTGSLSQLGSVAGTYRALLTKIDYLKKLGVTAVELMPVMEYVEYDWHRSPLSGDLLKNSWGYQTIAFQAPSAKYAADGCLGQQVLEFKYMVQELHRNGIEVILDIVFNHTGENDEHGPTLCFRGLDNNIYYMLAPQAPEFYVDHTGCRNTFNVNHPVVRQLIMDTLRYWVQEMHVDGFRFDLAPVFNYDIDGNQKERTPILAEIETDPILSKVKLIAEPWSADQYKLGHFAPSVWSEWNGSFRDTVRRFVKSDERQLVTLAARISGSPDWFDPAAGRHSINFVAAHDGFTLNDIVTYVDKHNQLNGENNRDGTDENFSWNWGVEGPVDRADLAEAEKETITRTRKRTIKNMLVLLFLSQGTPMLLAGDEFCRSANGNNNYWAQDELNLLDWQLLEQNEDILRFVQMIAALRREYRLGWRQQLVWHGALPYQQRFADNDRFLAWQTVPIAGRCGSIYIAFNMYWEPIAVTLPPGNWRRRVDTGLVTGSDIVSADNAAAVGEVYTLEARSCIVLTNS